MTKIQYQLDPEDELAFAGRGRIAQSRRQAWFGRAHIIIILGLIGTTGWQWYDAGRDMTLFWIMAATVLVLIAVVSYRRLFVRLRQASWAKNLRKATPLRYGAKEMVLQDGGIKIIGLKSETLIRWPAVGEVVEVGDHVFIYFATGDPGGKDAFVIPRKKIVEGNLDVFLAELRTRLLPRPGK